MGAKDNQLTGNIGTMAAGLPDRAKMVWSRLRPQQRVYCGAAVAVAIAALVVFGRLVATPSYKVLMTGLEPQDLQTITSELAEKKIKSQVGQDGKSISVPADQLEEARLAVASRNSISSGRIGYEIFDKVSWGQTEFNEKVNYQRALEGELERTIQSISDIKSARVHLVMATQSVFSDNERGAKASVTLRLKHGTLSREQVSQIARLVAGAVDNLDPKDVIVTDADSGQSPGRTQSGEEDGLEGNLSRRLIATLAPVVGSDHLRATVNVEYETSSSEENEEKYDPTVSVPLSMQRSEESYGSGTNSGVPGTSSNVPGAKQPTVPNANGTGSGPVSKTESATYGVNRTTRHEIDPAGSIKRITAAVLLDDSVERKEEKGHWVTTHVRRTPAEISTITALAQAAIGCDTARGDIVTVQNLAFDRETDADNAPASLLDRTRNTLSEFNSEVRYVVLLILFGAVYFLMFRPIQKRMIGAEQPALPVPQPQTPALGSTADPVDLHANMFHRSLALKKELTEFVHNDPESSAAAVRAWLQEES